MPTAENQDKSIPPYIPWKTFCNLIERFKATAVPPVLDNSVLLNFPGGMRGQIRSAMRFLGLADADGNVTGNLDQLVQSHGTDKWQSELWDVLETAYAPVVGELNIASATPAQLDKQFRNAGVSGQMADKSIRFFLSALESAGRQVSPFLLARGSRSAVSKGSRRNGKAGRPAQERASGAADEPPGDEEAAAAQPRTRTFHFPFPGQPDAKVIVPEDLDRDHWEMINLTLTAYAAACEKAKASEREEEDFSEGQEE